MQTKYKVINTIKELLDNILNKSIIYVYLFILILFKLNK